MLTISQSLSTLVFYFEIQQRMRGRNRHVRCLTPFIRRFVGNLVCKAIHALRRARICRAVLAGALDSWPTARDSSVQQPDNARGRYFIVHDQLCKLMSRHVLASWTCFFFSGSLCWPSCQAGETTNLQPSNSAAIALRYKTAAFTASTSALTHALARFIQNQVHDSQRLGVAEALGRGLAWLRQVADSVAKRPTFEEVRLLHIQVISVAAG
ncbi:Hypothetical_protein [Hexamita inflata]|uniref:Hypothetical_protein n=1 Tax=Hexamita inflata TaxID=28002 RepID=A0AA86U6C9_9EUKA|nr:Hypothetical protein HINF_LOCUS27137 [Hexamita inflata]